MTEFQAHKDGKLHMSSSQAAVHFAREAGVLKFLAYPSTDIVAREVTCCHKVSTVLGERRRFQMPCIISVL